MGWGPGNEDRDSASPLTDLYGVKFVNVKGAWSNAYMEVALQGIAAVGAKFAAIPAIGGAPWEAFRKIYGIALGQEMLLQWNTQCYYCRDEKLLPKCVDKDGKPVFSGAHNVLNKKGKPTGEIVDCQAYGAATYGSRQIVFAEFFGQYHVAHELGHAFDNRVDSRGRNALPDYLYDNREGFLSGIVQNSAPTPGEGFADMFTGWVYDGWRLGLRSELGEQRRDFMNLGIGGPPGFVGMDQLARCAAYGTCPTIP